MEKEMTGNNCVEGEVVTTIKKGKTLNLELQKKTVIEEGLLKYYNMMLYEKGVITERERNLMINMIDARTRRVLLE
ncbi:MAG: hypothetical protein IJF34_00815 [Clostridia bacterium]|nr:hypothetical protein [Clostridia bacterium]